jgi:uncharacterized membrane protein YeaQ/YmgE (transglycosylase-associated protein family)
MHSGIGIAVLVKLSCPPETGHNMDILIQLVLGAIGGNVGGALFKNLSLGTLGNSVAGLVGGGLGGQILSAVMGGAASGGMVGNVAGGGVGGIVVMAVVAMIKKAMAK